MVCIVFENIKNAIKYMWMCDFIYIYEYLFYVIIWENKIDEGFFFSLCFCSLNDD